MFGKSKRGIRIIVAILIVQLVLVISGSAWLLTWHMKNRVYFVGEIIIYRDEDFANRYHFPGNGTKEDPYIIENFIFSTKRLFGIKINQTSSHFIIRNCNIEAGYPIVLVNVSYGTARIENNIFTGQGRPSIELIYCPGTIVRNNICYGSVGIKTTGCYDSLISNNNCNNMRYGLHLLGLNDNLMVDNNTCNNNEYGIFFIHEDQYLYGKYMVSHSIVIANNTCNNNSERGMFVSWVENSTILGNNCSYNGRSGYGGRGLNLTIKRNYFSFNGKGMNIEYIINSSVSKNVFYNNTGLAIEIDDSTNTVFYANNFINNYYSGTLQNRSQVNDDSSLSSDYGPNIWYNATLSQGNYWAELVWFLGATYAIEGSDNEDLYPLENPVDI